MTRAGKKKVGRGMEGAEMCDLPADLVEQEILTRVPLTSLRAMRSTCKLWDALSKDCIFGKAAAVARRQQFLGFTTKKFSKVCSVRLNLCRNSKDKEDEDQDLLDLSVTKVDLLDQIKISRVFHCDGLLLCVVKDHSSLLMWNPYLEQTQWIGFITGFHRYDCYALGYDINRNHKILRFLEVYGRASERRYEIYEFSSKSWRVFKFFPDWDIDSLHVRMSVKGNTYFYAHENKRLEKDGELIKDPEYFLVCFDFTTERFGPRLRLPFHTRRVAFSCLKEEKLAVLYQHEPKELNHESCNIVQIWVTNTIEPNFVSWSQFLRVEMKPFACTALTGIRFGNNNRIFFIDEEEKLAVVFDFNGNLPPTETVTADAVCQHTTSVIREGGYLKHAREASKRFVTPEAWSSSYLPSLVQLNHQGQVPPPPPNLPSREPIIRKCCGGSWEENMWG